MSNHRAQKHAVSRRHPVDPRGTTDSASVPPDRSETAVPGGRRKAVKATRRDLRKAPVATPAKGPSTHGGLRKTLIPGIPSAPTLVGLAAMALAAAGAVSVSAPDTSSKLASSNIQKLSGQASVLSGASSIGSSSALSGRARAVSRDSQRQALQDAADEQLQAAAEKQAKQRNAALASLAASAEKQAGLIAKNTWDIPVTPGAYHLTSRFGECSTLWSHCHTGLDFAAPAGTPIHAVANATVTEVGYAGAYGNRTVVTLEDGTEMWYCHQTAYSVSTGQQVRAGEVIGSVGATGNTTGAHLHLEVRPGAGDPVDPFAALVAHGLHP